MPTLPQMQTNRVTRSEILVDPAINSRKMYQEGDDSPGAKHFLREVKRLSEDVKERGLLQPPVLMRIEQAGDDYADHDPAVRYLLIVGFRRQGALDLLGIDEATYSIAPPTWGIVEAKGANAAENLAREDLTPYEIAAWCQGMNDGGLSCAAIAKLVRAQDSDPEGKQTLSESHVENLVRCINNLAPEILAAWEAQHKAASLRFLIKLAPKDHAEQLAAWNEIVNPKAAGEEGEEGEEGEGGEGEGEAKPTARPSKQDIAAMLPSIEASDKSAEWKAGAIAALKWAAGTAKKIPGVKVIEATDGGKGKERAPKKAENGKGAKKGGRSGKAEGGSAENDAAPGAKA